MTIQEMFDKILQLSIKAKVKPGDALLKVDDGGEFPVSGIDFENGNPVFMYVTVDDDDCMTVYEAYEFLYGNNVKKSQPVLVRCDDMDRDESYSRPAGDVEIGHGVFVLTGGTPAGMLS